MPHKPLQIADLNLVFPHKTCFTDVRLDIRYGQRIALIGKNGSGKSSLLALLFANIANGSGVTVAMVPQIHAPSSLSGAELFMKTLGDAKACMPDILILDEPTNHLDSDNRVVLMHMLRAFAHTVIIATHDGELLQERFDTVWHLDDGSLRVHRGSYENYLVIRGHEQIALNNELKNIAQQKKHAHVALMKEQARAKNSRLLGEKNIEQRKWPTVVSSAKARRAEQTSGKKRASLNTLREEIIERHKALKQPEVLTPKFHFSSKLRGDILVSLQNASVGRTTALISNMNLTIRFGERVAILGKNGSGKSTLMKALMNDESIVRDGHWQMQTVDQVGYLDQNYLNLSHEKSAWQSLCELRPDWTVNELRCHLNAFLFRKNEEVMAEIKTLSGGERARLSLCLIAARAPRLLLLDEVTNNIDLDTRTHLVAALSGYDGAIVVISHDREFLRELNVRRWLKIRCGILETLAQGLRPADELSWINS